MPSHGDSLEIKLTVTGRNESNVYWSQATVEARIFFNCFDRWKAIVSIYVVGYGTDLTQWFKPLIVTSSFNCKALLQSFVRLRCGVRNTPKKKEKQKKEEDNKKRSEF